MWCEHPRVIEWIHVRIRSWWIWSNWFLIRDWNKVDVLDYGFLESMDWPMEIDHLESIINLSFLYEYRWYLIHSPFEKVYSVSCSIIWCLFIIILKMRYTVVFSTPCYWRLFNIICSFNHHNGILSNPNNSPIMNRLNLNDFERREMGLRLFSISFSISFNS